MKKISFIQYLIILIVAFFSLLLSGVISINACGTDQALINIYNKRVDLQKAFPGTATCNTKLIEWAKNYGWKEAPELLNYSPYSEIFNSLSLRISQLEEKIKTLSAPTLPAVNTTIIQKQEMEGEWRKCCGNTSGSLSCGDKMQDFECRKGGHWYQIYILSK